MKLIYKFGVMGAGKSLQVLATAHNFQEHKIPFILMKSSIDDGDGEDIIHSRALGDRECVTISPTDDLFKIILKYQEHVEATMSYSDSIKWIIVDECQFLTVEQVDQLAEIVDKLGINVMCYGLKGDFRTKLFPASKRLFEVADCVEELKSSCFCGRKAMFNARIDSDGRIVTDGNQIEVGGDDRYVALCRKCYYERLKNNNLTSD